MTQEKTLAEIYKKHFGKTVQKIKPLGKGAEGSVYLICSESGKTAVKVGTNASALLEERKMLDFLRSNGCKKAPQTFFFEQTQTAGLLAMEYISGTSGKSKKLLLTKNKKKLAKDIVETLETIQSIKSEKYGDYQNPTFDSWEEFYMSRFEPIFAFAKKSFESGKLSSTVFNAVSAAKSNFHEIFAVASSPACLCHGDFWLPNMIIDTKNSTLRGVLDPFKMIFAESEYELFGLTVGGGKNLHLYQLYKSRNQTSPLCDTKLELYALVNELDWMKNGADVSNNYLDYRAKRFLLESKKANL